MEGSESEKVFDSLNLNPQLFINEVFNSVDDMVDGAFEFYQQQALTVLGDSGNDRSDELCKAVSSIRNVIQEGLDKRMSMWEKYSLRHCFVVPQEFSLPKADTNGNSVIDQDALSETELDNQLNTLREKLYVVEQESAEMQRELNVLKQQSTLSDSCAKSVTEALQLCEEKSVHGMFQDIVSTSSKLRAELENLIMKRMSDSECVRNEIIYDSNKYQLFKHHPKDIFALKSKDIQELVADLENM